MHTRPGVCAHHLPKELHFPKKGARRQAFPNPNTNTAARTRAHPKSWNEGAILALCKCQARKWTGAPPQIKRQVCLYSLHLGNKPFDFVCKSITGDLCMHEALIFTLKFLQGCASGKWLKKQQQEKPSSHFLYSNICINVPLLNIYVALNVTFAYIMLQASFLLLNLYFLMQQMLILIYLLWAVQC